MARAREDGQIGARACFDSRDVDALIHALCYEMRIYWRTPCHKIPDAATFPEISAAESLLRYDAQKPLAYFWRRARCQDGYDAASGHCPHFSLCLQLLPISRHILLTADAAKPLRCLANSAIGFAHPILTISHDEAGSLILRQLTFHYN